ncbi:uncharacterized protein LOC119377845 [Rhipicephalus sanguineus]|uniref:uncharacterized protein LOC119377845 n=1 Tax=Rhipicephalus sanguineus TaxID=34632 RepID=UPI0020C3DDB9|nr:uncharacterized protein LOC119377845 [Rhipicephalus sanguineus]
MEPHARHGSSLQIDAPQMHQSQESMRVPLVQARYEHGDRQPAFMEPHARHGSSLQIDAPQMQQSQESMRVPLVEARYEHGNCQPAFVEPHARRGSSLQIDAPVMFPDVQNRDRTYCTLTPSNQSTTFPPLQERPPALRAPQSQEKILKELERIRLQNETIIQMLTAIVPRHTDQLGNFTFPLSSREDVSSLEDQLASSMELRRELVKRLAAIGGGTTGQAVRAQLRFIFEDSLASLYSYTGWKAKENFSHLHLCDIIKEAVKLNHRTRASDDEIKGFITIWLKNAKIRQGKRAG